MPIDPRPSGTGYSPFNQRSRAGSSVLVAVSLRCEVSQNQFGERGDPAPTHGGNTLVNLNTTILRAFDHAIPAGGRLVHSTPTLVNGRWIGWAALVFAVAAVMIWWSYRQTAAEISRFRRRFLTLLRLLIVALLLLIALRPSLRLTIESSVRRQVLFLLDTSASMSIVDPRLTPQDQARAAIATGQLDPTKGADQPPPHATTRPTSDRTSLLKSVLTNDRLALLKSLSTDYDVRFFSMGDAVTELFGNPATELTQAAATTPIGDDLRDLLDHTRGQTGGRGGARHRRPEQRRLRPRRRPAAGAKAAGVPVYTYGLGVTDAVDIQVASLFTPETAFVKDDIPVKVHVRGTGLVGSIGRVVLKLNNNQVDQKDVTFDGTDQTVDMKCTPDVPGNVELSASIDPRPDEAVKDNKHRQNARQGHRRENQSAAR